MTKRAWKFGTVVRVDPAKVRRPDDRRWMVLSFDDRLKWTFLYLGPSTDSFDAFERAETSHWPSTYGFCRVEDDDEGDDEHHPYIGEFD